VTARCGSTLIGAVVQGIQERSALLEAAHFIETSEPSSSLKGEVVPMAKAVEGTIESKVIGASEAGRGSMGSATAETADHSVTSERRLGEE